MALGIMTCLMLWACLMLWGSGTHARTEEITVAVASNFAAAMRDIAKTYEERSGHKVVLAFGSTGKHYAQILNGAPFDAFFAADSTRPQKLEEHGLTVPGSRFTYARGRLALWSATPGFVDDRGDILAKGKFAHLALANPKLAPYGRAAKETLMRMGLWNKLMPRLIRGENIGQAFQFVKTGAAELGFVAYAQIVTLTLPLSGSYWLVPEHLHMPIDQQAVLLNDRPAARDFFAFIKGESAQEIIRAYGYDRQARPLNKPGKETD
nr:molybdate ABC transporter substrate-binding protein [Luteithermobacter gelatinilyticus]